MSLTIGANTYSAAGIYLDTFSTTTCDSIFILNLQVTNAKRDSVTQTICNGESITVGANTYSATGVYRDTFSTTTCDSIHILNLTILSAKRDTVYIGFCEGESVAVGNKSYTQEGLFTDTITTSSCDSLLTVIVSTFPKPTVQISASETEVDGGDTVQLNATSGQLLNYLWTSIAALNNNSIQNPIATIVQPSWIIVQLSDSNNCTASDSIFITLKECAENIYVPNAFTPNSDGANDVFYVYGNCIQLNHFYVFNRWGEKMWDTSDILEGWNGYYKDVMQPMGVYVYLVDYSAINGKGRTLKGSVTLIR
jgi:gliding motility-associated-like protein